jgi:glycosyltransferase involved in cell wall biosynthesis
VNYELEPIVTFGLCVKNEEADVSGAVESVLSQDFPHGLMEVIVVDGCSKDRTVEIIQQVLSKEDISYRIFFENEGLGHARQMVVDNARGEYIIWVDGDIRLSRDYTREQIDFMEKNLKVGIAAGRSCAIYSDLNLMATLENLPTLVFNHRFAGKVTEKLPGTGGSLFRVQTIRQVGGFDQRIKGALEDTDIAYRAKLAGWQIYITQARFYTYLNGKLKEVWDKNFWYGYGLHFLLHKNSRLNEMLYKSTPFAGFIEGVVYSFPAYRLTGKKSSFLLPFYFLIKRLAWCLGFIKGHMDSYGHMQEAFPT